MRKKYRLFSAKIVQILLFMAIASPALSQDRSHPEIQALIGMKIPDDPVYRGPGRRAGSVSHVVDGWVCIGGSVSREFFVESCYHRSGLSAIFAYRRNPENRPYSVVVDAIGTRSSDIRIPFEAREELGVKRNKQKQNFSYMSCPKTDPEIMSPMVMAIGRPAIGMPDDCNHLTPRALKAWRIDTDEMRLTRHPTKNILCWWGACSLEKNCQDEDKCNTP